MSVNATWYIILVLGSSLVAKRHELLEYTRKAERSDALVRQILHKLRKKNLIYVHQELIVNIPLLLLYYYLSYRSSLLREDIATREVVEALVSEGVEEKTAADLVSEITKAYLGTYRKFIRYMRQYYRWWRRLISALEKKEMLNRVHELLMAYLGCLVPEGAKFIEMEYGKSDLSLIQSRDEFLGTRLFLVSLARFVEDRRVVDELRKVKEHLVEEIEKLRYDEDKHAQRFATLFLEQTISSAISKILPKFYATFIFYKLVKDKSRSRVRGKTSDED